MNIFKTKNWYSYVKTFWRIESLFEDIIFIDESGFSLSMRRSKGWSKKGQRANVQTKHIRSKNVSLIAAMSPHKLWKFEIITGASNSEIFNNYITTLLCEIRLEGIKNVLLIMDNASIHKKDEMREFIEQEGHQLLFLPPYSPFLNTIENVFHQWKKIVREKNPTNEKELIQAMKDAPYQIKQEQLKSYFRHSKTYFQRCENREPILD